MALLIPHILSMACCYVQVPVFSPLRPDAPSLLLGVYKVNTQSLVCLPSPTQIVCVCVLCVCVRP